MKNLFFIVITCVSVSILYAQNTTYSGRVIEENLKPLSGVSILINKSKEVGIVDANGYFEISVPEETKQIEFRFVGMETTMIELKDGCTEIEVVMMSLYTYDFMSLKKAEKKRKKRFKKLPEIHEMAFKKGVFKTSEPCYNREFPSLYVDNDLKD